MMLVSALILLLSAAEVDGAPAPRLPTVATVERIPLPRDMDKTTISVEPLARHVELHPIRDSRGVAARIVASGSRLCPRTSIDRGLVVLHCRSRQLDAQLVKDGGKDYLEIYELRGLPWRDQAKEILLFYNPLAFGLGGPCPGDTPLARGECALHAGDHTNAAVEFRRALNGDGRRMAALRLGDIALLNNDPGVAAGWFQVAGRNGAFGRAAMVRMCELSGSCFSRLRSNVFDPTLLPEPLHSEMLLRAARLNVYLGEFKEAMANLQRAISARGGACNGPTRSFCRRLVLAALEQPGLEGAQEALETYLGLPDRNEGELAMRLVHAAAEKAGAAGAPIFGGNLLAATMAKLDPADGYGFNEHLLRAAELYVLGGDLIRAHVITDYAETRLGRTRMDGPRWRTVLDEVQSDGEHPSLPAAEVLSAEAARDLALTYAAVAKSMGARLASSPTVEAKEGSAAAP